MLVFVFACFLVFTNFPLALNIASHSVASMDDCHQNVHMAVQRLCPHWLRSIFDCLGCELSNKGCSHSIREISHMQLRFKERVHKGTVA